MTLRTAFLLATVLASPMAAHAPRETSPVVPTGVHLAGLRVSATIVDGAATTELHQVVRNDTGRIAEAVWILPLPAGATCTTDGASCSASTLVTLELSPAALDTVREIV